MLLPYGVLLLGSVYLVSPGAVTGLGFAISAAARMPPDERTWRVDAAQAAARTCFGLERFVEGVLSVYRSADLA